MKNLYYYLSAFLILAGLSYTSTLAGQNLLGNPGFETGVLPPWFGDNDNMVTITTEAADGDYAAIGNAAQNVELTEGVNYELRCKARIISAETNERVWVGVRGPSALVQNFELTGTDWIDVAIDFTAPETGTHKIWVWGQGASSYSSDAWTLVVEGTSDVNDFESTERIKIVNRVDGIAINMTDLPGIAQVMIHDVSGRQVYATTTSQNNLLIDRASLFANGIYVVSVISGNLHRVEKIAALGR